MAKIAEVQEVAVSSLKPYERNAKIHGKEQIEKLKASILEFGFLTPCLIDRDNNIIAGHGRVMAASELGMQTVPCVYIEGLSEAQRRAYILADNRLGELGEWDMDIVDLELTELDDMNFDVSVTGFELPSEDDDVEITEDEAPEPPEEPKTKLGDIWQLGEHRLICGDSTDINVIDRLMDGVKADLYLTDPPYNVDYVGKTKDELTIQNDSFDTDEECGEQLWLPAFSNALLHSNECCSVYCFMPQGGTHMMMMMMMGKAGWQVKHELIWEKQSIVLNRADYNYQHEPIMYGWNKTHKFYGKGKYKNTSIWKFDRPTKSKEHPTMKPIELLAEILLNATEKGDAVLDTFGGSGSTLMACEQLKRRCFMCELDPHYCDVIINRWETFTGREAVLING